MIQNLHVLMRISSFLILTMTLAACGLSKPYPAKQLYALDVPPPVRYASGTGAAALRVQPVRMTEPYGNEQFHYRVGPARIEADYYANFVDEPGRLITAELTEWLAKTEEYQAVVGASSTVDTDRSVQLVINELYGDTSDPRLVKAVVAGRVFVLDESAVETSVLLTRDYRETEIASAPDGDALVEAWAAALARMFDRIAADLRTVR
jgi:uncharacterized lipoprotein YmbA